MNSVFLLQKTFRLTVFLLIASLFLTMVVYPVKTQETSTTTIVEFSENILLSTRDTLYQHHVEPTLAISDDGTLFTGWKNAFSHNGGGVRVSFSKSVDNGATWTTPFNMPKFENLNTGQSDPWMVWHDGMLYYAYLEFAMTGSGNINTDVLSQITVAKTVSGDEWTPVRATYGEGFADKETMAITSNGTIYVVYDDIDAESDVGPVKVRLTRSTDGGDTYQEVSVIVDSEVTPEDHVSPYVTVNGNDVYVAWLWFTGGLWGDINVIKSSDLGEMFIEAVEFNSVTDNVAFEVDVSNRVSRLSLPVIRFDQNDRLYALWTEKVEFDESWDVYLRYSDDFFHQNWSSRYQVNPVITGDQWQPDMDIDSEGRLHVVWLDEQNSNFKPYYRMISFPDGELSMSDPLAIANVSTSNSFTRPGDYFTVRVDSYDIPHVVWTDGRNGEMDIYYSHGVPEGSLTTTTTTTATASLTGLWMIVPAALVVISRYNKKTRR